MMVKPLSEHMKKKRVPKHTNLVKKSVILVVTNEGQPRRIMKAWKERDSITETELQQLTTRPAITKLEVWPSDAGYFLTMTFEEDVTLAAIGFVMPTIVVREGRDFFLSVRRVRNTPRTFKDLNRLKNFIEVTMPDVTHYIVHQNPADELQKLAERFEDVPELQPVAKTPAKKVATPKKAASKKKAAKKPTVKKTAKKTAAKKPKKG